MKYENLFQCIRNPVDPDFFSKGWDRELKFWRLWIERHGSKHVAAPPLYDYLLPFVDGPTKIADLGTGAACLMGRQPGVEVIASDFLADKYKEIWVEAGLEPEIPVTQQDMTQLDYDDESFDIVHCANAIDHCPDPRAAVREMVRVCKTGGIVYLYHLRDQARCAHYCGLHQWNVSVKMISRRMPAGPNESGRWSAQLNGFMLEEELPGVESGLAHGGSRVRTVWVKK